MFNGGKSGAPREQLWQSGSRFPCFHSNPCPITAVALFQYDGATSPLYVFMHVGAFVHLSDVVCYVCLMSLYPNVCAECCFTSLHPTPHPLSLLFAQALAGEKKSLTDVAACSHSRYPSSSSSHLSLLLPLSRPLSPPQSNNTHTCRHTNTLITWSTYCTTIGVPDRSLCPIRA